MADTLRGFFELRGAMGLLVVLKGEAKQFKHLNERLHISSSTLTKRIGEAKGLGLITPEIDDRETSVNNLYRITERGQYVVAKMERLDIVHAYRTMLDMHEQVEDGKQELVGWFESEGIQEALARRSDSDPYVDPFGEDATGFSGEDSDRDFDDEFFTKE
jgi:DNA-binding HxlR family transcriptional regulator